LGDVRAQRVLLAQRVFTGFVSAAWRGIATCQLPFRPSLSNRRAQPNRREVTVFRLDRSMFRALPATPGTQSANISQTWMAELLIRRSTCVTACLVASSRACARGLTDRSDRQGRARGNAQRRSAEVTSRLTWRFCPKTEPR
jgi:hypothetical protein